MAHQFLQTNVIFLGMCEVRCKCHVSRFPLECEILSIASKVSKLTGVGFYSMADSVVLTDSVPAAIHAKWMSFEVSQINGTHHNNNGEIIR